MPSATWQGGVDISRENMQDKTILIAHVRRFCVFWWTPVDIFQKSFLNHWVVMESWWIFICVCNIFVLDCFGSIYLCDLWMKLSPKALTSMKVEPLVWIISEWKLPNDYLGNIFDVSDGLVAPFQLRSYQHQEHPEHKFWEQFLSTIGTFLWHQVLELMGSNNCSDK